MAAVQDVEPDASATSQADTQETAPGLPYLPFLHGTTQGALPALPAAATAPSTSIDWGAPVEPSGTFALSDDTMELTSVTRMHSASSKLQNPFPPDQLPPPARPSRWRSHLAPGPAPDTAQPVLDDLAPDPARTLSSLHLPPIQGALAPTDEDTPADGGAAAAAPPTDLDISGVAVDSGGSLSPTPSSQDLAQPAASLTASRMSLAVALAPLHGDG